MSRRRRVGLVGLIAAFLGITIAAAACGSDDEGPNPPPFNGQEAGLPPLPPSGDRDPEQTDLLSWAPDILGNATLIADVGEPTEGPAWRDADGALYFTVPASANPLRRVVPGGPVETVTYDAGGTRLLGLATGGGDRLYATEPEALVGIDFDDAGAIAATTRSEGPGGTSFGDIAFVKSPYGDAFFFLDLSSTRTFRTTPDGGIEHVLGTQFDGGVRVSSIASQLGDGIASGAIVYVALSRTSSGGMLLSYSQFNSEAFAGAQTGNVGTALNNAPNGIALDTGRRFFIASPSGISILTPFGALEAPQRPISVRIAAIPTNLTFGGADHKTLFVTTAAGKIYAIPVTTPGILR